MVEEIVLGDAISANIKILQWLGFYPIKSENRMRKLLHDIYSFAIILVAYVLFMISEFINILYSFNDLDRLVDSSFLFLTHFAQSFKLYFIVKYRQRMQDVSESFDRPIFKPRNEEQRETLNTLIVTQKRIFAFFIGAGWFTCFLWSIFPMLETQAAKYTLPLPSYFPFDTNRSPHFELAYMYQIFAATVNASTNISLDTLISGYISLVGGQLDLLNDNLLNLKKYALETFGAGDGLVAEKREAKKARVQGAMDRMLVVCVHHHRNILQVTNEISEIFNVAILSQFVVSCIIICVTMYKLTVIDIVSLKFISICTYQLCMLVEIIVYCWFGNEVILKSEQLTVSAYHSEWTDASLSYKKKLLFLMVRTGVPLKMYAGNFFTLSLETFANILRTSWSYFAVLNQVQEE